MIVTDRLKQLTRDLSYLQGTCKAAVSRETGAVRMLEEATRDLRDMLEIVEKVRGTAPVLETELARLFKVVEITKAEAYILQGRCWFDLSADEVHLLEKEIAERAAV